MKKMIFPVCMAILSGIVFIQVMHNLTIGICMGILIGIAFGLFDSDRKEKEDA